jgi:capsular polysaccharide biosynthesis protein
MDRQKISNVVLVEEPQPSSLPKPKLSTTIVASYLLGCALIFGIAFCFSITRNTVYTPWELEAFTGLPVLATVPHERLPHSMLNLERLPAPELIP